MGKKVFELLQFSTQHFKSLATQSDDVVRRPRSDSVVTEAN